MTLYVADAVWRCPFSRSRPNTSAAEQPRRDTRDRVDRVEKRRSPYGSGGSTRLTRDVTVLAPSRAAGVSTSRGRPDEDTRSRHRPCFLDAADALALARDPALRSEAPRAAAGALDAGLNGGRTET